MPHVVTLEVDAAQAMGELLRQPGGLDLETTVDCPCAPDGEASPLWAHPEGVSCQCGRLVARWTGAPGVSDLAMVEAPSPT
jgi:hypothetical protein